MNSKLKKYILFIAIIQILIYSSCIDDLSLFNDDKPTQIEVPIPLIYSDADSLMFVSYRIEDSLNSKIYSDIYFTFDSVDNKYKANIEYFHTDLSSLKAIFRSNAKSIKVNDIKQISAYTTNNYYHEITYRLYTITGNYKDFTFQLTNNCDLDIPLLVINTEKAQSINNRYDWIRGKMIIDKQISNELDFTGEIEIKGRGNNSWGMPKKPYTIKLKEESFLLGMNKHSRWVLLANASDKTLLRNRVAFEISKKTSLAWTPDSKFVNVIINGSYVGNYLLCEQIKISENRVNISKMSYDDTSLEGVTGGYLIEIDRFYNEPTKFRSQFSNLPILLKEPEYLNTYQFNYIQNYINTIESYLYSDTISDNYHDYIDINSFIDWWIIYEITVNLDANLPGSCYMYKNIGGKLFAGPVWDFDLTTFKSSTTFHIKNKSLWYPQLFSDHYFKQLAKQRWIILKPSLETISDYINQQKIYIQNSATVNWAKWTLNNGSNQDEKLPWDEAVDKMKKNYIDRLNWMDAQISTW